MGLRSVAHVDDVVGNIGVYLCVTGVVLLPNALLHRVIPTVADVAHAAHYPGGMQVLCKLSNEYVSGHGQDVLAIRVG